MVSTVEPRTNQVSSHLVCSYRDLFRKLVNHVILFLKCLWRTLRPRKRRQRGDERSTCSIPVPSGLPRGLEPHGSAPLCFSNKQIIQLSSLLCQEDKLTPAWFGLWMIVQKFVKGLGIWHCFDIRSSDDILLKAIGLKVGGGKRKWLSRNLLFAEWVILSKPLRWIKPGLSLPEPTVQLD